MTWKLRTVDSDYYGDDGERHRTINLYVVDAEGNRVCDIHQDGAEPTEAERLNARQISAAPDGFALLQEIDAALANGADFQTGPKGRHHDLRERLAAYFDKATKPAK